MNKVIWICLLLVLLPSFLQGKKFYYLEEFYSLYYLSHHYQNNDINRNLFWLQRALRSPFAPPLQALVVPKTEKQYQHYKAIVKMHLHYLMTKNYIYLASRFEKHKPVFFNKPYAEQNLKSLKIARGLYKNADYYWQQTLLYCEQVKNKKINDITKLYFMEDTFYRIQTDELNYGRVISRHLQKIDNAETFFQTNTN